MSILDATQALQRCLLDRRLVGSNQYVVTGSMLESDGRKRPSVIKRLLKDGLMTALDESSNPSYVPTDKVLADVSADVTDFVAKWDDLPGTHRSVRETARDRWFVRFSDLSHAERLGVLDLAGEQGVRFYVVSSTPLQYAASHYADEPGPREGHGPCEWHGPFTTLEEAQAQRSECYSRQQNFRSGFEIVFDTEELEHHIESRCFEELFDENYPRHFAWALFKCGVLTEDEAFESYEEGGQSKKRPRVTVADGVGLIIGSRANVSAKPENWQADVSSGIDRIVEQIKQAQAKLELYRKIEKGLAAYDGGFNQFLLDYRQCLRTALAQEKKEAA